MTDTGNATDRTANLNPGCRVPGDGRRRQRRWTGAHAASVMLVFLWLAPIGAHADRRAAATAEALMAAHAAAAVPPEFDAIGVNAPTVDCHELSRQHGKSATGPAVKGTGGVAVILWDERGSQEIG